MLGDFEAWQLLAENFFLTNNAEEPFMNPFIVLVYVINMRANPLVVK